MKGVKSVVLLLVVCVFLAVRAEEESINVEETLKNIGETLKPLESFDAKEVQETLKSLESNSPNQQQQQQAVLLEVKETVPPFEELPSMSPNDDLDAGTVNAPLKNPKEFNGQDQFLAGQDYFKPDANTPQSVELRARIASLPEANSVLFGVQREKFGKSGKNKLRGVAVPASDLVMPTPASQEAVLGEIGRASCRERV